MKTVTVITWFIKLVFVDVVLEHTCHDAVSCFVKRVCGNWWQSSQNVMFPATHFFGLTFNCISVSLNCMETVLRFNFYELRALYLLDIIELWEIMWDFDVETCEMSEKVITSWSFNAVRQVIVLREEFLTRIMLAVC
jgi:hypothetical protein